MGRENKTRQRSSEPAGLTQRIAREVRARVSGHNRFFASQEVCVIRGEAEVSDNGRIGGNSSEAGLSNFPKPSAGDANPVASERVRTSGRARTAGLGPRLQASRRIVRIGSGDRVESGTNHPFVAIDGPGAKRDYIVTKLANRIQRTMLDPGSQIGFSPMPYGGERSIIRGKRAKDRRSLHIIRKPASFYEMLEHRPQEFATDCLSIIPITVFGTMRDVLIEDGYTPRAVDKLLSGLVIHDQNTHLAASFWRADKARPFEISKDEQRPTFSRLKTGKATSEIVYGQDGVIPSEVTLGFTVEPGDFLYAFNAGIGGYKNEDAQNGIILSQAPHGTPGDKIRVYAHRTKAAERDTSAGGIFRMLSDEVGKRGMPWTDFINRGGIVFVVAEFDYIGFYDYLVSGLRK